jgi:nitrogen regulatory protein PII
MAMQELEDMKMIRAIIRPNREEKIVEHLEKEGF